MKKITQGEAYQLGTDYQFEGPQITLGPWTSYSLLNDPKHMCFVLSRYKFCAKMMEGKESILEVGCGDGFGIPLIAQGAEYVLGIDIDNRLIDGNRKRLSKIKNIEFKLINICENIPDKKFDAAFCIDVIEHLDPEVEENFMKNISKCLIDDGLFIIGTPNITANEYATHRSKVQHINLKSHKTLRDLLNIYFKNVLMFSMNDEVLHTGYAPMAHYIWGIGVGLKKCLSKNKGDMY